MSSLQNCWVSPEHKTCLYTWVEVWRESIQDCTNPHNTCTVSSHNGRILPAPKLNNDTFKFQIKLIVILLWKSVVIFQVVYLLQNTCLMINIYIWWKILFIKYKNGGGEKFNWFDSFAAGVIALTIQSKLYDFLKTRITTQLDSYNAFGPTTLIQQGYSASFNTPLYSKELSSLVQRSQLNSWTIR